MTHEQGNTKTPWKFSPAHIEEGPSAVRAPEGYIVCTTASDADAELIVTAVNERATLLSQVRQKDEALEHAKQVLSGVVPIDHEDEDKDGDSKACQAAIASINAALSPAPQPGSDNCSVCGVDIERASDTVACGNSICPIQGVVHRQPQPDAAVKALVEDKR